MAFGTSPSPSAPPAGTPFEVYVYDDPNDDGDPLDLTGAHLVAQVAAISTSPDTDTFESVALPPTWVAGGLLGGVRDAPHDGDRAPHRRG